ncbi:glycosyltransferase [Virgibacillus halodenitrificans]|uniref:glycosyltransferase n=1 Tax=Virgibacillus halodenitrificans TaxID=1482 RepID=UPI00031904D7|nr:glycosyltransferase [Virgibacillus halodenitrificans]
MELLVAADSLFFKTPDGKYWCKTIYGYDFWLRYLAAFDDVVIVSRTNLASHSEIEGYLRVDGPNVRVLELPFMRGMKQYIKNYFSFNKAAKQAVENAECALIRLPSVSASMILKHYKRKGRPYAIEVVADPYDAYASNKVAQFLYTKKLKEAALQANGASYVTKYYLQSKYPAYSRLYGEEDEHFESYFSTIDLPENYFSYPRTYNENKKRFTIVHTANSINNEMKGHEVIIKVLKEIREKQYDVKVIFIGDGDKRIFYEQMSRDFGVEKYVTFTGLLPSAKKVREILLKGDIFVFPTKAEGLPRAVIEAMAVGLPVLSTPVNGIPELLDEEYMFDPMDVNGFVNKLVSLFNNLPELESMSENNIRKATEYTIDKLSVRRNVFYSRLRKLAESNKR